MSKHHDLSPNQRYKCNCSIFCIFCHTPYLFVHLQFNILTMVHSINQSRQNNCLTIHMNDRSIQLNSVTVHPNGLFPHLLIISVCDFQFMFFFCVNKWSWFKTNGDFVGEYADIYLLSGISQRSSITYLLSKQLIKKATSEFNSSSIHNEFRMCTFEVKI